MKKQITLYILLWLIVASVNLLAQPILSVSESKKLVEKTYLLTDRDIYCVDEKINFSAINISSPELREPEWSTVLYLELITPDGQLIARRKCAYDKDGASGTIKIPTGTLTGNYYLRAYTRWMRDFSPYDYFYKLVTVINPFRPESLESSNISNVQNNTNASQSLDSIKVGLVSGSLKLSANEQANFSLRIDEPDLMDNKYALSVVPSGSGSLITPEIRKTRDFEFSPDFIPETRGLSISGRVVSENDSIPMPYTLVGLTVFKESPEILNVRTNEKGQFYFDLSKLNGEFEIFISAKADVDKKPLILVDNDFSNAPVNLLFVPLSLSIETKELYQKLAFSSQIHTLYRQQLVNEITEDSVETRAFYGEPEFVLKLADYVSLPSISEYFYELVPSVRLKRDGKVNTLKVLGNYPELAIYDPLVLLDMVPIFDADKILALDPERVTRIEVMTVPYIRGDIVFGGIISLFSKKGDMAGINLPENGRFINYSMFSKSQPTDPQRLDKHIPDVNNCLYWNESLNPDKSGRFSFSFNTGNNRGQYCILLQSVTPEGKRKVVRIPISIE